MICGNTNAAKKYFWYSNNAETKETITYNQRTIAAPAPPNHEILIIRISHSIRGCPSNWRKRRSRIAIFGKPGHVKTGRSALPVYLEPNPPREMVHVSLRVLRGQWN